MNATHKYSHLAVYFVARRAHGMADDGAWVWFVDTNEQAHYGTRSVDRRRFLEQNLQASVVVRNLEVGDYALVWREASGDERVVALIERKTKQDLAASIIDSRYASQSARMIATEVPFLYWAIVEGALYDQKDVKRVRAAITHLNTRPRTRTFLVADGDNAFVSELAVYQRYIADELHAGGAYADVPLYARVQEKGAKTPLNTHDVVYREQLAVVRGMSVAKARGVVAVAPSMLDLHALWARRRREFLAGGTESSRKKKKRTLEDYVDGALEDVAWGAGKRLGPALSALLRVTHCPNIAALDALK